MNAVFDKNTSRKNKAYGARNLSKADFLFAHSRANLCERLKDISRHFDKGIILGVRDGYGLAQALKATGKINTVFVADDIDDADIYCDMEALPFADQSLDLIVANMTLHHVNDLPGTLIQIRRALKPDGLFLGTLMGGESLYALRETFTEADLAYTGGVIPRIHPFADKQQMGALMQRAGFALPVIDSDILNVSYKTLFDTHRDLKDMGEAVAISSRKITPLTKRFIHEVEAILRKKASDIHDNKRFTITFEQIYLCGWSPHESQQKPLPPGSAQNRLSEALNTKEKEIDYAQD